MEATKVYDNVEFIPNHKTMPDEIYTLNASKALEQDARDEHVIQNIDIPGNKSSISSITDNNYYSILGDREDEDDSEFERGIDNHKTTEVNKNERSEQIAIPKEDTSPTVIETSGGDDENQRSEYNKSVDHSHDVEISDESEQIINERDQNLPSPEPKKIQI